MKRGGSGRREEDFTLKKPLQSQVLQWTMCLNVWLGRFFSNQTCGIRVKGRVGEDWRMQAEKLTIIRAVAAEKSEFDLW